MHLLRKLSTASLFAGMLLTVGVADAAADCNSASSCTRQFACLPGLQLIKSGDTAYCQQSVAADTDTPTCVGKGPLPKNWVWAASYSYQGKKGMCVTKDNKGNVSDTNPDAITCNAGYSFNASIGQCEKPGGTFYDQPNIATP